MRYGYKKGDGLLNDCDVCLRPYTETIDLMEGVKHGRLEEAVINLAKTPDGHWLEGDSICIGTSGMSHAPSIIGKVFDTREDAIRHASACMESYIAKHPQADRIRRNVDKAIGIGAYDDPFEFFLDM